jgi:Family of unknown function (DUF6155)
MGLREVKSELNKLDKATLIKHISELYKKYKPVKDYFDFYLDPDEKKILNQYKEKVTEGFFPKRGDQLKLSISRKAINDFKKLGTSEESVADLLIHFVENGIEFTNTYGDVNESFYLSIENTYSNALDIIEKSGLMESFKPRAQKIVTDSTDTGWGFHECLSDLFYQYYEPV